MYTISCKSPCKKALLMSSWWIGHFAETAKERTIRIVAGLTTGLKVSVKSKPSTWLKPWATRRALRLSREPSLLYLFLKIHLQPITCEPGGGSTRVQVWLAHKASNSTFIAWYQLESVRAALTEVGTWLVTMVWKLLGLKILDFARVFIRWMFEGGGGEGTLLSSIWEGAEAEEGLEVSREVFVLGSVMVFGEEKRVEDKQELLEWSGWGGGVKDFSEGRTISEGGREVAGCEQSEGSKGLGVVL